MSELKTTKEQRAEWRKAAETNGTEDWEQRSSIPYGDGVTIFAGRFDANRTIVQWRFKFHRMLDYCAHILAFQPKNAIALLDDHDTLEAENADLRKELDEVTKPVLSEIFDEEFTCGNGKHHEMKGYNDTCVYCTIEDLQAENVALRKRALTCCFCDTPFGTLAELKQHSEVCEKHPVTSLRAQVQNLSSPVNWEERNKFSIRVTGTGDKIYYTEESVDNLIAARAALAPQPTTQEPEKGSGG